MRITHDNRHVQFVCAFFCVALRHYMVLVCLPFYANCSSMHSALLTIFTVYYFEVTKKRKTWHEEGEKKKHYRKCRFAWLYDSMHSAQSEFQKQQQKYTRILSESKGGLCHMLCDVFFFIIIKRLTWNREYLYRFSFGTNFMILCHFVYVCACMCNRSHCVCLLMDFCNFLTGLVAVDMIQFRYYFSFAVNRQLEWHHFKFSLC